MAYPGGILLIGNSVRYLAHSGQAAGIPVVGVDAFGDDDMRAACVRHYRAAAMTPYALLDAIPDSVLDAGLPWSYGAGFEAQPQWLAVLVRRNRRLLGNAPAVLELLAAPRRWHALLDELGIATPPVSHIPPARSAGWLFKPAGGAGGIGVRRVTCDESKGGCGIYQAYVKGPVYSLLFAADGRDSLPLGFNQVSARYPAAGDFRFAAVISGVIAGPRQAATMHAAAQRLTDALGLRGINGIDFVIANGEPLLLDLNVRPPASLELYEQRLQGGGFAAHLAACEGHLPELLHASGAVGLRVVYARRPLKLHDVAWPDGARDLAPAGSRVGAQQPVCTVHLAGPDSATVATRLRELADSVHERLQPFAEEAA